MTTERKPTGLQWLWGMGDWPEFEKYQRMGGGLSYNQWTQQGKPSPPTPITTYAESILKGAGAPPSPKVRVAPPSPGEQVATAQREAQRALGQVAPGAAPTPQPAIRWETISEGGWDYQVSYDKDGKEISREPLGRTELPPGEPEPTPPITPWQEEQIRLEEEERQRALEQQRQQQQWQEQQAAQEASQWQQQQQMQQQQWQEQMGWQQQQAQMQQQEQERQERARLAGQPISWLQYAAYTGEEPVVQPWMMPLMEQQYPSLQTGQPIPGWTPEGGQAMPQLTTPSAQLWGRMGPTSRQGFAGYRQARTGIRPEETQFRMQAGAPPGGVSPGLRWTR